MFVTQTEVRSGRQYIASCSNPALFFFCNEGGVTSALGLPSESPKRGGGDFEMDFARSNSKCWRLICS